MALSERSLISQVDRNRFEKDGYLIVKGLFRTDEVAELRDTFMRQADDGLIPGLFEVRESYRPEDPLSRYPRAMHPHRHMGQPVGPLSHRFLLDARVEEVLETLFGEEPIAAQSMFYYKPPGARGQAPHQDNFYLRVHPGTCIAAWTAVDDADGENGGLFVVPGSNRLEIACPEAADPASYFTTEHVRPPEGMNPIQLELKAGDVLFFNGSVIHGSNPNRSSDRFRRAFICHYVPSSSREVSRWYRPLLRFNGEEAFVEDATGGGPCGTVTEEAIVP